MKLPIIGHYRITMALKSGVVVTFRTHTCTASKIANDLTGITWREVWMRAKPLYIRLDAIDVVLCKWVLF